MAEPLGAALRRRVPRPGEPLVGTASRVQRWLVVEQPGAWGAEALVESKLDRSTAAAALDAAARRAPASGCCWPAGPASVAATASRRVFLAHTGAERRWIEQLVVCRPRPGGAARHRPRRARLPRPAGPRRAGPARRSTSCAPTAGTTRAAPTSAAPSSGRCVEAGAPDVWECSHVGGDRFAANVVCLPDGVYYGRVEPRRRRPRCWPTHRAGLLDLGHYRGRSCYPPLVQAAEAVRPPAPGRAPRRRR